MNMMKMTTVLLLSVLALTVGALAQETISDDELLGAFDDVRFFDADVTSLRTRIISETSDEVREAEVFLLFGELDGADASRIEFLSPEELAGQIYIATADGTFFFGPDLDEPLKVGGNTAVFGDSAVAQTAGIRFADDYTIEERRTVTGEDGVEILEVDLVAVDFTVAFQAATVKADPETFQPISVVLYAISGLAFYEVFYEEYVTRGEDDVYVSIQRIENRILVDRLTVSEILEIGTEALDAALFDLTQLGAEP
ncbi:MAG: hypothetical protein WBC63_02365 [Candidatus Bipolaricaulia bacterium]